MRACDHEKIEKKNCRVRLLSRVDGIKKTTPIVDLTFGDCPGCSRPGRTINNCGLQGFNVVISIMSLSAKESFGPMKASSGGYSGPKCSRHGSSSIDMDPAFAEAICTNCGIVLEASNIVANIQFEENTHGGSLAIRQFVHSDSKGSETGAGVVGGAEEGGERRQRLWCHCRLWTGVKGDHPHQGQEEHQGTGKPAAHAPAPD